jgi:hypothetical protein
MSTIFLNEKESSFAKSYKENLSSEIVKGGEGSGGVREGAGRPAGSGGSANTSTIANEYKAECKRYDLDPNDRQNYHEFMEEKYPEHQDKVGVETAVMNEVEDGPGPSYAQDADEEEVEVELLSSGQSVPVDITEAMRDSFGDSRSANEAVNRFLDVPSNAKWFDDEYSGNEFDLKHDIENLVG